MKNLSELYQLMKNDDPRVLDQHGQWRTDLPTFGGAEPESTFAVWSWDKNNVIYGTCNDDLQIISREELQFKIAAATLGRKGGASKSPAKAAASAKNMAKARAARKQVGWPKGKPRKPRPKGGREE